MRLDEAVRDKDFSFVVNRCENPQGHVVFYPEFVNHYMYTQETHTDTRYDSMCFNAAPTLYMNDNFIIEWKNRFLS